MIFEPLKNSKPSSFITGVHYDETTQTLTLEMKSGKHSYHGVPPSHDRGIRSAESAGTYYNEHIKPHYRHTPHHG